MLFLLFLLLPLMQHDSGEWSDTQVKVKALKSKVGLLFNTTGFL